MHEVWVQQFFQFEFHKLVSDYILRVVLGLCLFSFWVFLTLILVSQDPKSPDLSIMPLSPPLWSIRGSEATRDLLDPLALNSLQLIHLYVFNYIQGASGQ